MRSLTGRRASAASLIFAILAVFAATLLPPDCDGLPGFEDNDGDVDAVCLWERTPVAAPPSGVATLEAPRLHALADPEDATVLVDDSPRRALPSRSPPGS